MHYALYRKYRPLTFSDVVGQNHITKTLTNQVSTNQLSHAYLFCGTRGTGKTTCAKILSRAVNCLTPINGEPCNECEVCKGILDGSIFDVMEIDAASNNGVENIRQIRDEIVYTPVKAKYKVYIIDEVHMLSPGAFNALLKTLEEPPAHVIFILATTESHKIPATILSRCQRFDFRRLSVKDISDQINKILKLENKTADEKTVRLVATLADGSVRDSLSILEKVAESNSYEEAEALLGVIGRGKLYNIAESMADENIDDLYKFVDELYFSSKDLSLMINELTAVFRDLLAVKSAVTADNFLDKSEEDIRALRALAKKYSYEHIVYAMDTLFEASNSFSRSPDKRAAAELCLVKIAKPVFSESNDALIARLGKLESRLKDLEVNGVKTVQIPEQQAQVQPEPQKSEQIKAEPKPEKIVTEKKIPPMPEEPPMPDFDDSMIPPPPEEYLPPVPADEFFEEAPIPEEKPLPTATTKPIQEKRPEPIQRSAPTDVNPSDEEGGPWQELMALKDIADTVREKDRGLCALLANYCRAVYNKKQVVFLCDNDRDLAELKTPQNMAIISEALEKNRRVGYEVKVAKGNINEYVKQNSTYDNIESNGYFDFN
ncbi:MAG: DNA polymerase III subunit gamma/tau [Ruminococcaceae bacterium]|nr:DNA polymerase III subunit gamma/tau [Oscillospiraceae bacterium]